MNYSTKLLAAGLLATVSTAALSTVAKADPLVGPYIGLGAGASWLDDFAPKGSGSRWSYNNPGFTGEIDGGYSFGNGFRAELEGAYLQDDVKNFHGGLAGNSGGTVKQFSYLVNGLYDFDGLGWPVIPHLGVGAGLSTLHQGTSGPVGVGLGGARFTYQGIAGIEYPLGDGLNLGLDYRYLSTVNVRATSAEFGTSHDNLDSNNLLLTLRYTFAPPPPPPPAPPAPPPAPPAPQAQAPEQQRAFQVFFDFNKYNITEEAAATIQKAADEVKSGHITTIDVTGHTDTVGTVKYNLKLSVRRADAVKEQLVADGVPGDEITTQGVGKAGLLVPTPDGVREPQNRRAEIVLH